MAFRCRDCNQFVSRDHEHVWQVDVGYACGGIVTCGDRVVEAAPIFNWMVGKTRAEVRRFVAQRDGRIRAVHR